MTESNGEVLAN